MRKPSLRPIKPGSLRRIIGMAQNVLIVLLIVSAVVLAGGRAGFSFEGSLPRYAGPGPDEGSGLAEYGAAAEPMCILTTPERGVHDAAMYDGRALEEAYSLYSSALAEALGSAGEPVETGFSDWERALSGPGVYFDYYTDLQLSSLAAWLGSEMSSSAAGDTARRLCLSLSGGEVSLYYVHGRYNTVWRCSTELNYTELYERVAESRNRSASFVFELENPLEHVDPYAVVVSGQIELRSVSGENSLDTGNAASIMAAFGMNANLVSSYTETDGTDVYLEGSTTLRPGSGGVLRFVRPVDEPASAPIAPSDAVQLTREVLEGTVGLESGAAELRLSHIFYDTAAGEYTLRYDYVIDGLPVRLQGRECAAELRLSGGVLTFADIAFRGYSYTGGIERPMPALLAAAAADAAGGEPRLEYFDSYISVGADWFVV